MSQTDSALMPNAFRYTEPNNPYPAGEIDWSRVKLVPAPEPAPGAKWNGDVVRVDGGRP